jgi:hypothetical protein
MKSAPSLRPKVVQTGTAQNIRKKIRFVAATLNLSEKISRRHIEKAAFHTNNNCALSNLPLQITLFDTGSQPPSLTCKQEIISCRKDQIASAI